jgi:hypothetical protein
MEKAKRLREIAESLPASAGNEKTKEKSTSYSSFSFIKGAAAPTRVKSQRLQSILVQAKANAASHRKSVQRETVRMAGGWYHTGFPKQTVYRVEDLVAYWRACMVQHFKQNTPPLHFPFYLRPKVLEWLRADGHAICEQVVAYAVRMWEPLRSEFEIEAEHPTMNVIWGFRKVFYKRMRQTGAGRRWGGHWNGEAEGEYAEAVS